MVAIFCSPSRYVQGLKASLRLGKEMHFLGMQAPVYILSSKTSSKLFSEMWEESFKEVGFDYHVEIFKGECSTREIERNIAKAKEIKAAVIVGAGGGKVLDTARAVASQMNLPVVNCPSLASSDSPCSALSVVYREDGSFEKYNIYKKNPDLVLVDTSVIAKSPSKFLVAGMGDALATMFEAKACVLGRKNNMRGGGPTMASLALAELCYDTLLADGTSALSSLRAGVPSQALERIVEANTLLSGLGFESSGLAAAHAIHNGLTVIEETHRHLHGEKVAFGTLTQLVLEGQPKELIDEVMEFCCSVGLPVTLEQLSIKKVDSSLAEKVALRTCQEGETIFNEPFEIIDEEVANALLVANEMGHQWLERHR